jgi:hypothetical protein
MNTNTRKVRWTGLICGLAFLTEGAPIAATAAGAATVAAVVLTADTAEAQGVWGVSRRTARRTSRRVDRRQDYRENYLYGPPAGAQTVVVGGTQYYESEGVRYTAQVVDGQTVYVVAN